MNKLDNVIKVLGQGEETTHKQMTDNDLNELTHTVSDFLDKFGVKVDRYEVNDALEAMCNSFGIKIYYS